MTLTTFTTLTTFKTLVGTPGLEPETYRLKAGCSEPIELRPRNSSSLPMSFDIVKIHQIHLHIQRHRNVAPDGLSIARPSLSMKFASEDFRWRFGRFRRVLKRSKNASLMWHGWKESNFQPTVLETGALPIELHPCKSENKRKN